jgi:hypothetical protein
MFARSDPQWHRASLFICNLLCIDVHDGSGRFRHAFSDVLRMSGSRPSSAEKSSQERPFRLPRRRSNLDLAAHLRLSLDCFAVARNDGLLDSLFPDDSYQGSSPSWRSSCSTAASRGGRCFCTVFQTARCRTSS